MRPTTLATLASVLAVALAAIAFDCPPVPKIFSVTPNSGPYVGGTAITLTGAGFISSTTLSFGGNPAANVTVVSSTSMTATTPPGTVGPVDLYVTNITFGGATNVLAGGFTYQPAVFTYHNDNQRTGQYLNETILTPANVNSTTFGRLYSYTLDGKAYTAPLYVANLNLPNLGVHNVVYVATEHDSVYALDADGLSTSPLWQVSFINPPNVTTVPTADVSPSTSINPEIGITGTPVIDPTSGTLYVVAKTKETVGSTTTYVQRLHALDLASGAEKFGGPVVIQASVAGTGDGAQGGQVAFDPLRGNQRPALLLLNGVVFVGFGIHQGAGLFHGWILGFDASTLQLVMTYNSTPNGGAGGIWQSGGGLAADSGRNLYFATGDGTFDADSGGPDYGDSIVKMSPTGTVLDYFTPHDQANMASFDLDLGSAGPLLLPDQSGALPHELVTADKTGRIYLVNRDNMGHYHSTDQIPQELTGIFPLYPGNWNPPVYFNASVYFGPAMDSIRAFSVSAGVSSSSSTSLSPNSYGYPGGAMAISANGTSNGILWAVDPGTRALYAYDASNLATELYNSNQAGSRDTLDLPTKFTPPVVVNGRVYIASSSQLAAYGLLP